MTGKIQYGPYNVTQGGTGSIVRDPDAPTAVASSGGSEPSWPASEYATVVDGGVTWTAIFARVAQGVVAHVVNQQVFQHNCTQYPDHYFQYGLVTWTSGANKGFTCAVRDSGGVSDTQPIPYLFLFEILPNEILDGDTFEATVGCAKIRTSCQKFNNIDNHRAFPDMPTEDRALATPNMSAAGYSPKQTK